jgi:hypothetical protein
MKHGIKVQWEDGTTTWMMSFSEYTSSGDPKPATYNSLNEARDAAENMRLKNYTVEPIND